MLMSLQAFGQLKVRGSKENITNFILTEFHPLEGENYHIEEDEYDWILYVPEKGIWSKSSKDLGIIQDVHYRYTFFLTENENITNLFLQAEYLEAEVLEAFSKKYGVDFHFFGTIAEQLFNREIEVINGEITKDKHLHYDDYFWDSPVIF
jgi:hypothetical protein